MKKILFSILCLLFLPLMVKASQYTITNFYVQANILASGDMSVKELIVMDGTFNGYERDLVYKNSKLSVYTPGKIDFSNSSIYNALGISNLSVKGGYVTDVNYDALVNNNFSEFKNVASASEGDTLKYTKTITQDGYNIKMYNYTNDGKTAYLINYTVDSAVVMHNDLAELYWTFIGDEFEDDIDDVIIKVYLPSNDNTDNFRIWAHGNLNGKIDFIKDNDNKLGAIATITDLKARNTADIRMTFTKDLITGTNVKYSKEDALDKILAVESKKANDANNERKRIKAVFYTVVYSSYIYIALIILLWIFLYFRFDKERKPMFQSKYNREFIDDYNVEVVDYLMNHTITPNAMSASIMNLVYKKNLTVEKIEKDYLFTLVNRDKLNDAENYLCDFLFNKIGENNQFNTSKLSLYARNTEFCTDFVNSYTKWQNKVLFDSRKQEFFEDNNAPKAFGIIMLIIVIILAIFSASVEAETILPYVALVLGIAFLIYSLSITKKTVKGIEDYAKWQGFKNFLNDFGTFELKDLPEIALWERYLVYATVFGLAKKVSKEMNVRIKEYGMDDAMYNNTIFYYDFAPSINSSINSAVNGARNAVNVKNASSSMSDGSGLGGGGFSSGGGFGGGGGGGHGF